MRRARATEAGITCEPSPGGFWGLLLGDRSRSFFVGKYNGHGSYNIFQAKIHFSPIWIVAWIRFVNFWVREYVKGKWMAILYFIGAYVYQLYCTCKCSQTYTQLVITKYAPVQLDELMKYWNISIVNSCCPCHPLKPSVSPGSSSWMATLGPWRFPLSSHPSAIASVFTHSSMNIYFANCFEYYMCSCVCAYIIIWHLTLCLNFFHWFIDSAKIWVPTLCETLC